MKIEIVEFYPHRPHKKYKLSGSLHIYLCDLDIDLRGVLVRNTKPDRWLFFLPTLKEYDPEEKKKITFPVFNFTDRAKNREIIDALHKQGIPYIKENFLKKRKEK